MEHLLERNEIEVLNQKIKSIEEKIEKLEHLIKIITYKI